LPDALRQLDPVEAGHDQVRDHEVEPLVSNEREGLLAIARAFFLYLDEFHSFTTQSLATMLSELRKYHVGLVLAHQYLAQLDPMILEAILGYVGTIICFRIGPGDAEILSREFHPTFSVADLTNLPNYAIYFRLMIDGRSRHSSAPRP